MDDNCFKIYPLKGPILLQKERKIRFQSSPRYRPSYGRTPHDAHASDNRPLDIICTQCRFH